MRSRAGIVTISLVVGACSAAPLSVAPPIELVGDVSNPRATGWYLDFCDNGTVTFGLPKCIQSGGEIYEVALRGARDSSGAAVIPKLVIGFPAHALPRSYRVKARVYLEKAPVELSKSTGIEYLARRWDEV